MHLFLDKAAGFFNIWNDKVRHVRHVVMYWPVALLHARHDI